MGLAEVGCADAVLGFARVDCAVACSARTACSLGSCLDLVQAALSAMDPVGMDFAEGVFAVVAFAGMGHRNLVSCPNDCGIRHRIACSSYSASQHT